jgi:hypothetical protein
MTRAAPASISGTAQASSVAPVVETVLIKQVHSRGGLKSIDCLSGRLPFGSDRHSNLSDEPLDHAALLLPRSRGEVLAEVLHFLFDCADFPFSSLRALITTLEVFQQFLNGSPLLSKLAKCLAKGLSRHAGARVGVEEEEAHLGFLKLLKPALCCGTLLGCVGRLFRSLACNDPAEGIAVHDEFLKVSPDLFLHNRGRNERVSAVARPALPAVV